MKFTTTDDRPEVYVGDSYKEIVEQMALRKFTQPRSRASYRKATARRANIFLLRRIDPHTDETFVNSLVDAGMLRRVHDE